MRWGEVKIPQARHILLLKDADQSWGPDIQLGQRGQTHTRSQMVGWKRGEGKGRGVGEIQSDQGGQCNYVEEDCPHCSGQVVKNVNGKKRGRGERGNTPMKPPFYPASSIPNTHPTPFPRGDYT